MLQMTPHTTDLIITPRIIHIPEITQRSTENVPLCKGSPEQECPSINPYLPLFQLHTNFSDQEGPPL